MTGSGAHPAGLAFVTPTFVPDLERCELLVESLDRFAADFTHYLLVDSRELPAFRHLESARTRLVPSEELIGLRQWRVGLGGRNYWLNPRTLPMRGWMRQQVLKLAAARALGPEVLVCLDSDVAFVRPFTPDLIREAGKWDLLDVDYVAGDVPKWTEVACSLLGLDPAATPLRGHVGHFVVWCRDHVEAMLNRIEAVTGQPWQVAIGRKFTVSEYILYGVFVRNLLGYEQSHHVPSSKPLVRQPWGHDLQSDAGLRAFICDPEPGNVGVMVHSKFGIAPGRLRPFFRSAWQVAS